MKDEAKPIPTEAIVPGSQAEIPVTEKERNYTKEREERCKPVIEQILKLMLEKKLVLSTDLSYIEQIVNQHLSNIIRHVVFENAQAIFVTVNESLNNWFDFAVQKKIGKPLKELTLEDVEKMINPDYGKEPPARDKSAN